MQHTLWLESIHWHGSYCGIQWSWRSPRRKHQQIIISIFIAGGDVPLTNSLVCHFKHIFSSQVSSIRHEISGKVHWCAKINSLKYLSLICVLDPKHLDEKAASWVGFDIGGASFGRAECWWRPERAHFCLPHASSVSNTRPSFVISMRPSHIRWATLQLPTDARSDYLIWCQGQFPTFLIRLPPKRLKDREGLPGRAVGSSASYLQLCVPSY